MPFSRNHLAPSHFSDQYPAQDSKEKVEQWLSGSFLSMTLNESGHSDIELSDAMDIDGSNDSESPVKPEPTRHACTYNLVKKKTLASTKHTPRKYALYARNIHRYPPKSQSSPKFEPLCARRLFP